MNDFRKIIIGIIIGSLISITIIIGFDITSIPLSFIIGLLSGGFFTALSLSIL